MTKDFSYLEQKIKDLEERVASLEADKKTDPNVGTKSKDLSVKEFIIKYKPNTDVERTLVIAGYLEQEQELASFNIEDIRNGFRQGRIPSPLNINDKINMNIKKGFIMDAGEAKDDKKAWVLTATGETELEQIFNNTRRKE